MYTPMAFLQPAVGLLADTALHQGFLDVVVRGIERRRILTASFRARQNRILVEILNGLFVHLHRGPEARIQITVEIDLIDCESPYIFFREAGQVPVSFIIFLRSKILLEPLQTAIDILLRWLRRARYDRFVAHDPLID